MMRGDEIRQAKELWNSARASLDLFLHSPDRQDLAWRNAKNAHMDYLESRMLEVQKWLHGDISDGEIGPLADARNIYWDEPQTPLQKEYCDKVLHLFNFLRKHGIGVKRSE